MSKAELQADKTRTYDAIIRLIESDRAQTAAFRKLTRRLEWLDAEMLKRGHDGPKRVDSRMIRDVWTVA